MERDTAGDVLLAVLVAAAQTGVVAAVAAHRSVSVSPAGYALLVAGGLALAGRRRWPVPVLAATYAATFGYLATDNPAGGIWLSVIVAFGSAIYFRRRVAAIVFLVAGYVGFLWGPVVVRGSHHAPRTTFALALGLALLVLLGAAEGVRLTRQRAGALAHGREQEALRRAGEERLRIARELHDVVAHSLAVISVQSGTALHLVDRQPERARLALSTINEVSKEALAEVRSVLGILRQDGAAPRTPAPSLRRLDELTVRAEAAGLRVRVVRRGAHDELPADVDLAAYRIVQEALTNAARHAQATTVWVQIDHRPGEVRIRVDDDGRGPAPGRRPGSGIVGMTERAAALGGTLAAGSAPAGGFRVSAVLPVVAGR